MNYWRSRRDKTSLVERGLHISAIAIFVLSLNSTDADAAEPISDSSHTIFGMVMELRSGTPDVPVCLCDAATGLPIAKDTRRPMVWDKAAGGNPTENMSIVLTDEKGRFRFENVPDGKYRLIAQKWIGPYKGVLEEHGTVIQLMGTSNEIRVPRPDDYHEALVALTPPGKNIVQLDQEVGNDATVMLLSTAPVEFDPILGLHAMGQAFHQNIVGINRMMLGKTTVIGAPNTKLYAFFLAPDNSPGFATVEIPPSTTGWARVPAVPFVAGWSNGRKTPPAKLAELMEFLERHSLTASGLLKIPELSNANFDAYQARMAELMRELSRPVDLPEGRSARVGDLLAAEAYRKLNR